MRRSIPALVLLWIISVAATAKLVTVTTPMTRDLDGGGFNVVNVANVQTAAGAILGGNGVAVSDVTVVDHLGNFTTAMSLRVGTFDPSLTGLDLNPGSLYLRRVGGDPLQPWTGTGELWFKFGPTPTDWNRVAF